MPLTPDSISTPACLAVASRSSEPSRFICVVMAGNTPLQQVRFMKDNLRDDQLFLRRINSSISSASMGIFAIRSTGPFSVTRTSFSSRTAKPSSRT